MELKLSTNARENTWLKTMTTTSLNENVCYLYVSADSKLQKETWNSKMKEILERKKSKHEKVPMAAMNTKKPALPPRKF
jgi:hypothetical protein